MRKHKWLYILIVILIILLALFISNYRPGAYSGPCSSDGWNFHTLFHPYKYPAPTYIKGSSIPIGYNCPAGKPTNYLVAIALPLVIVIFIAAIAIFIWNKQNLEHGGIKVTIKAAQSLSHQEKTIPVTVILTNTNKTPHVIKSVTAEIQATEDASGMSMALNNAVQLRNTTNNNEMYSMQTITIAQANSAEKFELQPNESKTISLIIDIDNKLKQNDYKYSINVNAEVEGIKLNPHTHQSLQIL